MAKTKNKTKKASNSIYSQKILVIAALFILLIIIGIDLIIIVHGNKVKSNDNLTKQTLNEYKIKIDKISQEIQQKHGNKPMLSQFCYRTSEEFSDGSIFCTQKLTLIKRGIADKEAIQHIKEINDIAKANGMPSEDISPSLEFNDKQAISISSQFHSTNRVSCGSQLSAFGVNYTGLDLNSSYEIIIYCSGGQFKNSIYPMRD